ncbi:hypothetical protein RTP6_005754 [Batrachochytrium dendrobatidis]
MSVEPVDDSKNMKLACPICGDMILSTVFPFHRRKHQLTTRVTLDDGFIAKISRKDDQSPFICYCGGEHNTPGGLRKHIKKCTHIESAKSTMQRNDVTTKATKKRARSTSLSSTTRANIDQEGLPLDESVRNGHRSGHRDEKHTHLTRSDSHESGLLQPYVSDRQPLEVSRADTLKQSTTKLKTTLSMSTPIPQSPAELDSFVHQLASNSGLFVIPGVPESKFVVNLTNQVLICLLCCDVVSCEERDLKLHLDMHGLKSLYAPIQKAIVTRKWDLLKGRHPDFIKMTTPTAMLREPVEGVEIFVNGYRCRYCVFYTRKAESYRKHLDKKHQKRNRQILDQCHIQTFRLGSGEYRHIGVLGTNSGEIDANSNLSDDVEMDSRQESTTEYPSSKFPTEPADKEPTWMQSSSPSSCTVSFISTQPAFENEGVQTPTSIQFLPSPDEVFESKLGFMQEMERLGLDFVFNVIQKPTTLKLDSKTIPCTSESMLEDPSLWTGFISDAMLEYWLAIDGDLGNRHCNSLMLRKAICSTDGVLRSSSIMQPIRDSDMVKTYAETASHFIIFIDNLSRSTHADMQHLIPENVMHSMDQFKKAIVHAVSEHPNSNRQLILSALQTLLSDLVHVRHTLAQGRSSHLIYWFLMFLMLDVDKRLKPVSVLVHLVQQLMHFCRLVVFAEIVALDPLSDARFQNEQDHLCFVRDDRNTPFGLLSEVMEQLADICSS